ncbi:hypothetical protein DL93DRAFT_2084577 [Clavulina sp. PMI_390]|nr:hypothetical protein DL93DRAFT_2084577 [Clavulina sp. PMI_390]
MSDFKQIEGLNPQMYDSLHIEDCSWLEAQLDVLSSTHETTSTLKDSPDSRATVERKVVVFTHHPPTSKASDPKHIDPSYPNPISSGFVNDMGKAAEGLELSGNPRKRGVLIRPPIRTWAFGHTHWCFDEMQNGVRLVSNQRGYRDGKENRDLHFRKDFVIVL